MVKQANDAISISVISNIIFEPHFISLIELNFEKDNPAIYPIPLEEYQEYNYRQQLSRSDMVVVWLNYKELFPDNANKRYANVLTEPQAIEEGVSACEKLHDDIRSISPNAHILWFSFEAYYAFMPITMGYAYNSLIDKVNSKLAELLCSKAVFIDLEHLIAEVGIANAYDSRGKYRWNAPYSKALVEVAAKEIYKQYLIEKGLTKKCLVFDCDNVLWGGILSEDGVENIKLGGSGFGRAYQDFQRFILSLYYHGVILAVCSKNDLFDVMTMFREHSEMVLKEEHIACFQVNWENKPDNIKRIAETLNIDLDSMVFVDDSPIEIEAVKAMLPEVTTILYTRDTMYEQFSCFNLKCDVDSGSIEKRNESYQTNQFRESLKAQYNSYEDYINALEIKLDIHKAMPIEYSRISELTQRTNKCTNGIRYTIAEIKERVDLENVTLYSLSVFDRFSDLGLVGAIEVEADTLTLFSLSCRALGREIESGMLEHIASKYQIGNIKFKSTGKNEDIKMLLLKAFQGAILT